jgi:hypothetical protein
MVENMKVRVSFKQFGLNVYVYTGKETFRTNSSLRFTGQDDRYEFPT